MRHIALANPMPSGVPLNRGWTILHVTLIQVAALILPFLAALGTRGPGVLVAGGTAIATALVWEAAFARARQRAVTVHGLTTGLIVAVMAPAAAEPWQIALAVSFGAVIAELAFGGRGFGFVNAGLAALAFLLFSFPGLTPGGASVAVAVAALPGGAALVMTGLVSWRILLATALGLIAVAGVGGMAPDPALTAAALVFPVIFLVADPLGAAVTNPGRIAHGLLAGGLVALFMGSGNTAPDPGHIVFAALIASIFAPLLDEIAIRTLATLRERRHG